ncbi:MAG: sigma-70 family RNA polymerase sigma factor [Sedimentisphaerales bacterium]|nr:sigma-70 family RNA polymerase sigma factor [Sedimentisphaerales bacterium]
MRSIVCDFHVSEDLFQKICLLALQAKDRFNDGEHLLKWLWVVSRNESLKYLRDKKKQPVVFDEKLLDLIQNEWQADTFLESPEIQSILEKCISQLSEPVQKMLEQRYRHNLTGAKLAEALERNTKSVYVAISRAHRALYNCMQKKLAPLKD